MSASDANNRDQATIAAVYVQDQIRLSPMARDRRRPALRQLQVEGRRLPRRRRRVQPHATSSGRRASAWSSSRCDNLSLYASYSRSYLPQSGDQFSGLDINTAALKPERFDNYEIGAKWEPIAGAARHRRRSTGSTAPTPAPPTRRQPDLPADRRAAQPGHRARAGAQRQQPLAGVRRLCLAEGRGHRGDHRLPDRRLRSPAGPAPHLLVVEPLRCDRALGLGLGLIARSKSFASIGNR